MAYLRLVPQNVNINFVGIRFITFLISTIVVLATVITMSTKGLNYGIDFEGGYIFEVRLKEEPNIPELRNKLASLNLGETAIQKFGADHDVLVRVERKVAEGADENASQQKVIDTVKGAIGVDQDYRRIETIGPKVGEELVHNSMKAVLLALAAMLIYIAVRFEWQFAVCGIIALIHDTVGILALFSIFPFEFNETAIIAILITAGYSINDTIVIFDRIRENLRKYKKMELGALINKSLNETLSRTVLTGATTLTSLLALYIWGGSVISSFSLPIIIGIMIGSFSSIFLASPLLLYLNIKRGEEVAVPTNSN
ncbi:protein translocase subunit SecF [Candidatus Odyssella acanthamoebae]|uniref:Protein-export membrane protein SecF n=1 Tax=Candidatus Odyssella acanthamoebae TaxID=91604 RepID=A0A077AUS8_9PROT|nr:protein translocase subunit SecF [Candidatus Paracaedibacter acanthamoebae]AIK95784.1 preprotein translocase subunit SecF [Candidatus Paracaedibacter acanthamoebae]